MRRVLSVTVTLLLAVTAARASPWWVSWNGEAFPETEGWTRWAVGPEAVRWLDDGRLFMDSRAEWGTTEQYAQERSGEMTLGSMETLAVHWRIKVDDVVPPGSADPGVWISSDDQWNVSFTLSTDAIHSGYEAGKWAPFTSGVFHEFWFESSDMRTYVLSIDGVPALQGCFVESLFYGPGVGWGDVTTNGSLSEWDFVTCGITPEPSCALCLFAACGAVAGAHCRRSR